MARYPFFAAMPYWLPPLFLVCGMLAGYYCEPGISSWTVSAALVAGLAIVYRCHRQRQGMALAVCASLSALLGLAITERHLAEAVATFPTPDDLDRSYRIRARVVHHWETEFGSALQVDRLRVLSPEKADFDLDRLTLYTPEMETPPQPRSEITCWITLKRQWDARPIPWPMQHLRERFLPGFHGTVKDLRLMQYAEFRPAPETGLNQGNRELVEVFFKGTPSYLWRERLAPFGLGHLLAISGLHCLLVFLGLQMFLWPLRQPVLRAILTVAGLLGFAHWVGWSASVTRASLMLSFWQVLPFINRPRSWLRLWTGLLVIGLAANPGLILMRGFWYSFAASLGLILGSRNEPPSPLEHPWLQRLRRVLPIVAAQMFVIPINLLFQAHTVFTDLLWNLGGFAVLVLLLGLFGLCLPALIWPGFAPLPNALERGLSSLLAGLDPGPTSFELVRFPHHPAMALAVLVGLMFILKWGKRERRWYLASGLLLVFCLFQRPHSGERLVMLDTGQGLCLLYVSPAGKGVLFDAGGALPAGLDLARVTRLFGARRMERAYISHADEDHYGLLADLPPTFPLFVPSGQLAGFEALPELRGYAFVSVTPGHGWSWAGIRASVLWPPSGTRFPNDNEESLVMLLEGDAWSLLFTGDAGRWMERRIEIPRDKAFHMLQVGHHGSRSASGPEFIREVAPKIALIACGRRNRFGHPHPTVLDTLQAAGVTVLTTAEKGSITLMKNGRLSMFEP